MEKGNKIHSISIFFIVVFSLYTCFLIINSITPLMGEDYVLVAFPKDYTPSSFIELVTMALFRIQDQMTNWNIRIGEQLSILFSCFDKVVFNVANSVIALAYLFLIYIYAFKKTIAFTLKEAFYLLTEFFLIILFQPALGELFFWRTGSTNYLWAICLLLTFSLPIWHYVGPQSKDIIGNSLWKSFFLLILGFFSGFTNENTVIVILALYAIVIGNNVHKRVKTPVWIYLSSFSLLIGFLCMYKAPSTTKRIQYYNNLYNAGDIDLSTYLNRAYNIVRRFGHDNLALIVITTAVIVLYITFYFYRNKKILPLFTENNSILWLLCLSSLSCAALVMSPYIETRAFLLPDFFMTACIIYYLERIFSYLKRAPKVLFSLSLSCVMIMLSFKMWIHIYYTYYDYYKYTNFRSYAIENDDQTQQSSAFLWGEYPRPYYSRILTSREDYLSGNEQALSYYYGHVIKCWENYLWNFHPSGLYAEITGNIDTIVYDSSRDSLSIYGWSSFQNPALIPLNNNIYCYLEANGQKYYFRTQAVYRKDVEDFFGNTNYSMSGFQCNISSVREVLDNPDIKVGICIVNQADNLMNDSAIIKHLVLE